MITLIVVFTELWVLYMSLDKFLLAVESRDLSQADKCNIRVSSFTKLCDGSRTVNYTKKNYFALGNLVKLMFWSISSFKNFQLSFSQFFGER